MLYFWNPDDSLIPNMMIDTSPWSSCSRRSPWSPWSPCSSHTFSSTGPSVSPFRDFYSRFEPDNGLIGFQDAWGKCWNYTWVGALCDNTDCVKDISGFLCFDWKVEYFTVRPQTSHLLNHNVFMMFEVHQNHNHGVRPKSHKHKIPYMGFCASIWDNVRHHCHPHHHHTEK